MKKNILFLVFLPLLFVLGACSSTDGVKDEAKELPIIDTIDYEPGSQEDLTQNIGDRVFFEVDSSALSIDSKDIINRWAAWLQDNHDVRVIIEGHCDERGTRQYNYALSLKRAEAVKNALIAAGISKNRLRVVGYGKDRPEIVGSTPSAWAQNRRSVLTVE